MSFVITEPYQFIAGLDGEALDAGTIYYGQPNQDPIQYPKTVYYDVDLSIPAPQPLRTVNGYIVRNGKPSFLFADGNYSILVLDKHGRQVFYVADFFLVGNAVPLMLSQISAPILNIAALRALDKTKYRFAQTSGYYTANDGGSGRYYLDVADTTSVDNGGTIIVATDGGRWKLITNEVYNVKQWGAKGDGSTDDTNIIQGVINAIPNGSTIRFPVGRYVVLPATSVLYHDKFNVTRKTGVQITARSNLTFQCDTGSSFYVTGTDTERVAFFFKNCTGITLSRPYFPNVSGSTSIAGSTYLPSEDYNPFAFEGCNGVNVYRPRFEASRNGLFLDAYNGTLNQNVIVDGQESYQLCNYSVIVRNAKNVQMLNCRFEQTGRSWNTSNEDVAFSDNSFNCKAVNCDAIDPIGTVSRFTASKTVGPILFSECRRTGGGIFVEVFESSNVTVSDGISTNTQDTSSHILFTADIFVNNANVIVTGCQFSNGGYVISDFYPLGWGGSNIPGLLFEDNLCFNTFGPQMSQKRDGVIFKGNRFDLNNAGQQIVPGGVGTVFEGNSVINGFVTVLQGDAFKAIGNHMKGNTGAPIAYAWDFQNTHHIIEEGNTYGEGGATGYLVYFNGTPAGATYGFRRWSIGVGGNPQFVLGTFLIGALGDTVLNSLYSTGQPERFMCVTAGTPGTWIPVGQQGYRTGTVAPTANAQFVGEEFLDTVANKWYKSKNTGTGASDWVALN